MRHKPDSVRPPVDDTDGDSRTATSRLRLLDFDDLFLLSHLLEGATIAATAKQLGLTQPAITQRVRKIERVFQEPILQKVGRHVRLTKDGRAVCIKAADALALMRAVAAEPEARALTLGSSAFAAHALLYPVASDLMRADPPLVCHVFVGAHDEMRASLEAGTTDAWLTAGATPAGPFEHVPLGDEDYVFVASPEIASTIQATEDLGERLLLELDRAYPLLARVESTARSALRFKDVWFLGSLANLLAAAVAGHGVAILPHDLVRAPLAAGKLATILPEIETTPIDLALVCRKDKSLEPALERVIAAMRARRAVR